MNNKAHKREATLTCVYIVFASLLLISCFFAGEPEDNRGSIIDNEIGATIYMVDGKTPAVGARVKIFNADDTTRTPEKQTTTDDNGIYSFYGLAKGAYNVWAEKDDLVAFQDSVVVTVDTVFYKNDTLGNAYSLSAFVGIQPNHDPRTVTVQVLGTHKYSNVDEDGLFSLTGLAKGEYNLRLVTTLPEYTPTFYSLVINENIPDTLQDTIWMIHTGIPIVTGLTASYDTLNGIVRLTWNNTSYRDFQEYVIFKDDFNAVNKSESPYKTTTDPVFTDTIFRENSDSFKFSFSDSNDYHYKYRVAVRTNSEKLGATFKYSDVVAASPTKIKPSFEVSVIHGFRNERIDSVSINDTLRICLKILNKYRKVSKITWKDSTADTLIRHYKLDIPANNIVDTLKYSWSEVGEKTIEIIVEDAGTATWHNIINDVTVYKNVPLLFPINDTLTSETDSILITVSASDNNPDGSIEKYYWDKGVDGWDDSTDTPEYHFYSTNCGSLPVVWGARNNDDVIRTDTFSILFICPPEKPTLSSPEDYKGWSGYDPITGKGTLPLILAAENSNEGVVELIFTLFIGDNPSDLKQVYSGKDSHFELKLIDTNSTIFWRLEANDQYNESAVNSGSFISPPLPPPYICLKGSFLDTRDSAQYACVEIGDQTWMAENLNFIPNSGNHWCYDNDSSNCDLLGRLYDWNIAVANTNGNNKDICPYGWHLPSDAEWLILEEYIGADVGKILKATSWNGTDDYGFSALPSGRVSTTKWFSDYGTLSNFWTATEIPDNYGEPYFVDAWARQFSSDNIISRRAVVKGWGHSIRCLEDIN